MGRKTIRIAIPRKSPDGMLKLLGAIKKKHDELGVDSPLDPDDATAIENILVEISPIREQAKEAERLSQSLHNRVRVRLGMGAGQSTETNDTALYVITHVRDTLLVEHRGVEEALSTFGYDVVIRTSKSPKRRKKKKDNAPQ